MTSQTFLSSPEVLLKFCHNGWQF